jgi:predicted ABC-type ATPase
LRDANLQAVTRLERWLEATIEVHRSLGVETVLSTDKYRRLVSLAKSRGFQIRFVYVILRSPELNIQRVQSRVRSGGHDVPHDKIVERYWRSLQQLPWFFGQSDQAWIFDNSGAELVLLADKAAGTIRLHDEITIPAVAEAVRSLI